MLWMIALLGTAMGYSSLAEDFINQDKGTKKAPLVVEKADYTGWKLVWNDEFDKDGRPDPKKWNYEEGFVRNEEPQWYQAKNAFCKGGNLVIEGRKEKINNPRYKKESKSWHLNRKQAEYSSASLTTKKKFAWLYGRFECRGRFLPVEGMWPAFWTVGITERWPSCGEIDIMEYYQGTYLANLCWASERKSIGQWSTTRTPVDRLREKDPLWDSKFHVFRMDWNKDSISLYVDDILLNRTMLDKTKNALFEKQENPFHQPQAIILNLALGKAGGKLDKIKWPATFEVDYVRVYQRVDAPETGTIDLEGKMR
ncbi:glycoside hydrolase family 16 protein [Akkermansia sp. N21169]|nr:glycoside hydrolase family 16 protein [Akkermansia sp. N21169]